MFGQRRFGRIPRWDHQDAARFGRRDGGGQRACNRAQLAGQAQLAQELVRQQRLRRDLATGGKNAQGDGQIVAPAFLGQVGGRQVQGDAPLREIKARAEQRRTYAFARLAHTGFGQTDDLGGGQATGKMYFHPHQRGLDPGAGTAVDQGQAHVCFLQRERLDGAAVTLSVAIRHCWPGA